MKTAAFYYIKVLDACMKNCGEELHSEVFSKSFMDAMKTVVMVITTIIYNNYIDDITASG